MEKIFTPEHYNALIEAERRLMDLLPVFDNAEACGLKCQELRNEAIKFRDQFAEIKRRFFTPPPQ